VRVRLVRAEQGVGGHRARGEQLVGLLGTGDGRACRVQQPDLDQHGGLIPVDMLMAELAAPEASHHAHRQPYPLASGGTPGSRWFIAMSWVNDNTSSSATWSLPMVREIRSMVVPAGQWPMKVCW